MISSPEHNNSFTTHTTHTHIMTTIAELITATLKISINEQTRAIVNINKDLIRLLAAEYDFDPEVAIAKFLDDDYVIPDESPGTVKVPKEKGKKKKAKKEVDPDAPVKPKKAKNAFMLFTAANREQVKADNPDIKPTDISKKMGEMWAELEDEDKEEYVEEAEKLKAEYLEQKEKWEEEMKAYEEAKAVSTTS
tara:strand:+ start:211 stop:789 length:579 start_codon:yes stop_codon:yes gene_type:complete